MRCRLRARQACARGIREVHEPLERPERGWDYHTIKLAPPLSVVKLGEVDLKVDKNCVLNQIVKTTKAFQGMLLDNGAQKALKKAEAPNKGTQGALPDHGADGEVDEFMTTVSNSAFVQIPTIY